MRKHPDYKRLEAQRRAYWAMDADSRKAHDKARLMEQYNEARSRGDYASMQNIARHPSF